MRKLLLFSILVLQIFSIQAFAQIGKIKGVVKDASTNEPLIGANVLLEGTTIGSATNVYGYYVIINVPPGTYNLKVSMIGYAPGIVQQLRVSIDQTTEINFELIPITFQTEEVVVVAKTPIVQKDVSASRVNLNIKEIENLPITSISGVIGLQAGVRSGLEIRGGSASQTAFLLDGITLRDERDNSPFTGISYSAIDEVQIQTGGFNAEYGNIRSGLVNVVTKEGARDKYTFSLITRYSSASQKHFGMSPNDPNSYWIRPYVDPQVAWFGTEAIDPVSGQKVWDAYTQQQYPKFEGWVSVAAKTLLDDDPTNDLTPEQAQKIFLWQYRRVLDIQNPDYEIDGSLGGPVPFARELGNLKFFASYRQTQSMYVVPLSRDGLNDWVGQLKLTSDVGPGMKLMVQGLLSEVQGTNHNNAGLPGIFRSPESIGSVMNRVSYIDARIFAPNYWAPSTIKYTSFGGKFTNVINPTTLYEVTLSTFKSKYSTNPGSARDTSKIYNVGGILLDEAPFGFADFPSTGINGLRMGVGFSNSRDSSEVSVYSAKFDFQSQIDRINNFKTGIEIVYTDNRVNYGSVDKFLPSGRSRSVWSNFPIRGALYVQDKLEFEGMIANVGVRLDYSDPQGEWYEYDPYNKAFTSENSLGLDTLLKKVSVDKQLDVSPRLGISFPITIDNKLYFNYGHFRSMPTPENLFLLRRFSDNNQVTRIADPNNPLPKTVSYELGFEQNLFDELLFKLAGYYKDVSLQSRLVTYVSRDNKVSYSRTEPKNYQDVRGFEITLTKNRGNWVQGFINYTYDVRSAGNFGFGTYYQNASEQRRYEAVTRDTYQEKPIPRPFANANIDLFTPYDFGPKIGNLYLLGDFRVSFVGSWTSGYYFTWAGGGSIPGIENNVQWNDFWNVDLRISKPFNLMGLNLQIFVDISNLFNYKYMTTYGFVDNSDYLAYMKSLHLPAEIGDPLGYGNIPGNDRPGDYRTGPYIPWDKNASDSQKEEWTKNKSYIDMPNQEYFNFLNPRDVFWGLKLSFAF
ncbi:MAG: TonB-dependent receptor [Bacteroidetes bacterium]|nr:TonB-dependent receptor [Bacteroidota bacterium]MBU2584443.1 TonB-dependent receptor [Bacteroidota bacterium]